VGSYNKTVKELIKWKKVRKRWLIDTGEEKRCFYCSEILTKKTTTIDHVVPIAKNGGKYDTDNFVVCCHECNHKKGNKTFSQWMKCGGEKYLTDKIKGKKK